MKGLLVVANTVLALSVAGLIAFLVMVVSTLPADITLPVGLYLAFRLGVIVLLIALAVYALQGGINAYRELPDATRDRVKRAVMPALHIGLREGLREAEKADDARVRRLAKMVRKYHHLATKP